jgi:hypothetical protein
MNEEMQSALRRLEKQNAELTRRLDAQREANVTLMGTNQELKAALETAVNLYPGLDYVLQQAAFENGRDEIDAGLLESWQDGDEHESPFYEWPEP